MCQIYAGRNDPPRRAAEDVGRKQDLATPDLAREDVQLHRRLAEAVKGTKEHQVQITQMHNRIRYLQNEESRAMKKMSDSQKRTLKAQNNKESRRLLEEAVNMQLESDLVNKRHKAWEARSKSKQAKENAQQLQIMERQE